MKTRPDPKPAPRIRDPYVFRRLHLRGGECLACGEHGMNLHHVLPRSLGGDDVEANLVFLCGSGTTGCHGAYHAGEPEVIAGIGAVLEDATVAYVLGKLGPDAGRDFLRRRYAREVGWERT